MVMSAEEECYIDRPDPRSLSLNQVKTTKQQNNKTIGVCPLFIIYYLLWLGNWAWLGSLLQEE
jgi:hypothetical protein